VTATLVKTTHKIGCAKCRRLNETRSSGGLAHLDLDEMLFLQEVHATVLTVHPLMKPSTLGRSGALRVTATFEPNEGARVARRRK
jgi:hypothetical protein